MDPSKANFDFDAEFYSTNAWGWSGSGAPISSIVPTSVPGGPGMGTRSMSSETGIRPASTESAMRSMSSDTGIRSMSSETGIRSMLSEAGIRAIPTDMGMRSIPTDLGMRSMSTDMGMRSMPTDLGMRSLPPEMGMRSMLPEMGIRSTPPGMGIRSMPFEMGMRSMSSETGTSGLSNIQRFQFDQLAATLPDTIGEMTRDGQDIEATANGMGTKVSGHDTSGEFVFPSTILNYEPDFKTLVPPLHYATDEVHWMHPLGNSFFDFLLEDSYGDEDIYPNECQLFKTAVDEPLPFSQRQNLIREIETNPDMVNYFELTKANLPDLVKHNQQLAIAVLLALMEQRDITFLLDVLVEMELSVNTMEVVNRLANNLIPGSQGAALPRPFLHTYISNSIVHCGNITTPQLQNRQARLVCVFLQSLFRNNIIGIHLIPQALLFQIEAFCVQFGRIREATALFTYIKELEGSDLSSSVGTAEVPSKSSSSTVDDHVTTKESDERENFREAAGASGSSSFRNF